MRCTLLAVVGLCVDIETEESSGIVIYCNLLWLNLETDVLTSIYEKKKKRKLYILC